jgi:hypothetical protein
MRLPTQAVAASGLFRLPARASCRPRYATCAAACQPSVVVTVMGRSHAASGAAGWLVACAAAAAVGHRPAFTTVVVGAVVAAGFAVAPDADHPQATVSRVLGPVSQWAAGWVAYCCAWLHAETATRRDAPRRNGHRTASHTAAAGLAAGWVVAEACAVAVLPAGTRRFRRYARRLGRRGHDLLDCARARRMVVAGRAGGVWLARPSDGRCAHQLRLSNPVAAHDPATALVPGGYAARAAVPCGRRVGADAGRACYHRRRSGLSRLATRHPLTPEGIAPCPHSGPSPAG